MLKKTYTIAAISCFSILFLLIIDTQTAKDSALAGIELCLKVLIPSLFPFFLMISYTNSLLTGHSFPWIRPLGRLLQIPQGGESILLLGFLGGYPVGAQLIGEMYRNKQISQQIAHILLGYCNNAGPAFIFGVTGLLFSNPWVPAVIWLIHIISAVLTGYLLPKPTLSQIEFGKTATISLTASMQKSIGICCAVCGWVVIFRIIQGYILKYLDEFAGSILMVILGGILELSTGCIALQELSSEAFRFILTSGFLAFGGTCVILQTASVTQDLGMGLYFPGKMIQTAIALIMSALFAIQHIRISVFIGIIMPSVLLILIVNAVVKKRCGNPKKNHV